VSNYLRKIFFSSINVVGFSKFIKERLEDCYCVKSDRVSLGFQPLSGNLLIRFFDVERTPLVHKAITAGLPIVFVGTSRPINAPGDPLISSSPNYTPPSLLILGARLLRYLYSLIRVSLPWDYVLLERISSKMVRVVPLANRARIFLVKYLLEV
jgi:hypothetical protein